MSTMIAPNDSDHSEPGGDSSDESAMNGAPTDIGVIEAAYHDGVVAGVAAMRLDRAGAARAWHRRGWRL
jgi:hypothetical protein